MQYVRTRTLYALIITVTMATTPTSAYVIINKRANGFMNIFMSSAVRRKRDWLFCVATLEISEGIEAGTRR